VFYSISQGSSGLHGGSSMPGYDMSATRAAMMSVTVTEPAKPSLLMLDDLGMGGSAPKAVPPAAYSNNTNLSKDFINSKVTFSFIAFDVKLFNYVYCLCRLGPVGRDKIIIHLVILVSSCCSEFNCKTYS